MSEIDLFRSALRTRIADKWISLGLTYREFNAIFQVWVRNPKEFNSLHKEAAGGIGSLATLTGSLHQSDRNIGLANYQYNLVHKHGIYDLEINTELKKTHECAQQIKKYLHGNPHLNAFKALKQSSSN
jgi:hypothetical protein